MEAIGLSPKLTILDRLENIEDRNGIYSALFPHDGSSSEKKEDDIVEEEDETEEDNTSSDVTSEEGENEDSTSTAAPEYE